MPVDLKRVETAESEGGYFHHCSIELGSQPIDLEDFDARLLEVCKWYGDEGSGLARARYVVVLNEDNSKEIVLFSPYDHKDCAPGIPVTLERALKAVSHKVDIVAGFGEVLMTRECHTTGARYLTDNFLDRDAGEVDASEGQAEYVSKVLIATLGRDNFNFIYSYKAQAIVDAFENWE